MNESKDEKCPCNNCIPIYCKKNKTACKVFAHYISTGCVDESRSRAPMKRIFNYLFKQAAL